MRGWSEKESQVTVQRTVWEDDLVDSGVVIPPTERKGLEVFRELESWVRDEGFT